MGEAVEVDEAAAGGAFDGDGDVDGVDAQTPVDWNRDGAINVADTQIVAANFGFAPNLASTRDAV